MDIVVIGAGPGGLMASGIAAQNGANVTLIEKNEKVGKKLYITGKGRCNLTNQISPNDFLDKVVNNSKFLYSAINKFSPKDCYEFFENNGVKLKVERGNRVFPQSDKSSDIIKALEHFATINGVVIKLNTQVLSINKLNNKFILTTNNGVYNCDRLIIATGGKSYTSTGSTGDGYTFAKKLGHNITQILPALVPIDLKDFDSSLAGISLKNVGINIKIQNKTFTEFGEMLFTHTGVSGPIVLSLSSKINKLNYKNAILSIDLKPALDFNQLDARLIRDFENNKNKNFVNYLPSIIIKGLINEFCKRLSFDKNKKIHDITKLERQQVISVLKNFNFVIKELKPIEFGIVTCGGVDVKQINPNTMQSKLVEGLYFAGEILDLDALTGGFNIQIALSTGYVAGQNCTKEN